MTIDEDSRNPKTDSQHYAQGAIHSPYIQKCRHVGSGVRRFMQNRHSAQLAWPKMEQINSQGSSKSQQFRVYTYLAKQSVVGLPNHVTPAETSPQVMPDA